MVRQLAHSGGADFGSSLAEPDLAEQSGQSADTVAWGEFYADSVEQPAGAFLMVRRAVWQELGGFDEGFSRSGSRMWISAGGRRRGAMFVYTRRRLRGTRGGHSIASYRWRTGAFIGIVVY
jgi:hypothetical protein